MKIAIDARIINSGTGRYIERLLHYLEQIDDTNQYLILVRRADLDYYQPQKPNFTVIEAEFNNYSFGEQIGLARLLRKLGPDLVHFCMPQQPLMYTGPAVTSILDLNLLHITANDDMNAVELRIKKAIFGALLKKVARRSRHILTISNYSQQDIVRYCHVDTDKITVAYLAADKFEGEPKPMPVYASKQFIMYVGRAEPYKNNRRLMQAHQQLLTKNPDLHLLIVGRQDVLRQADMEWASKQGFKNIDFLGFVSDPQLAWLYAHCRAYVFPSLMEGFGFPSLEAMNYGAPVASSFATCLPEVNGDAAVYFDPENLADMVQVIGNLINDDKLRAELATKGYKQVKKYSWRDMAEQTLAMYNQALQQKTD
jgi:glycosyltransferase involved in cell wall biosynthesis